MGSSTRRRNRSDGAALVNIDWRVRRVHAAAAASAAAAAAAATAAAVVKACGPLAWRGTVWQCRRRCWRRRRRIGVTPSGRDANGLGSEMVLNADWLMRWNKSRLINSSNNKCRLARLHWNVCRRSAQPPYRPRKVLERERAQHDGPHSITGGGRGVQRQRELGAKPPEAEMVNMQKFGLILAFLTLVS